MERTKTIKIDWDFFPTGSQLSLFARRFNNCDLKFHSLRLTNHGVHFELKSKRKLSFWRIIELRDYLNDDPKRIVKDILRYRSGAKMIDVLFDKKTRINETVNIK